MINGLIGKKLGVTQIMDPTGNVLAVTVGPARSVHRLADQDRTDRRLRGGAGHLRQEEASRVSSAARGRFCQRAGIAPGIKTTRFDKRGESELKLGSRSRLPTYSVRRYGRRQRDLQRARVPGRHQAVSFCGLSGLAEPTNTSVTAARSAIARIPDGFARGCGSAGQMGNVTATVLNLNVIDILTGCHAVLISARCRTPTARS